VERYRFRFMERLDKEQWKQFKAEVTTKLTQPQYKLLCTLHAKYFNHTYYEPCSCRPKELKRWIADIDRLYTK
jgi:hypothetical protein